MTATAQVCPGHSLTNVPLPTLKEQGPADQAYLGPTCDPWPFLRPRDAMSVWGTRQPLCDKDVEALELYGPGVELPRCMRQERAGGNVSTSLLEHLSSPHPNQDRREFKGW